MIDNASASMLFKEQHPQVVPYLNRIANTSHPVYAAMIGYIVYALLFHSSQSEWNRSIVIACAVMLTICLSWLFVGILRKPIAAFAFAMFCIPFSFGEQAIAHVPSLLFLVISAYHFLLTLPLILLDPNSTDLQT